MTLLFSPVFLLFLLLLLGWGLGKIRLGSLSLGLAGILMASLLMGSLWDGDPAPFSLFSSLGTHLFIFAAGLSGGYSLCSGSKSPFLFFSLGAAMILAAFFGAKLLLWLDPSLDPSLTLGLLCGAVTSTPGLCVLKELTAIRPELAVTGYSYAYLPGLLTALFSVQLAPAAFSISPVSEIKNSFSCQTPALEGWIQVAAAVVAGSFLGSLPPFSLGSSGGILCASLFLGYAAKKWHLPEFTPSTLSFLRTGGLALFFVGSGVPAGAQFTQSFHGILLLYGLFLALLPIGTGWLLGLLFRLPRREDRLCCIAGGMTSSPAAAILLEQNPSIDLAPYSMAYLGALMTMVIGIRFLP